MILNKAHPPRRMLAILLLVGATLFWAGNYLVGAAVVREMSPFNLAYLRWLIALPPLLIIAQYVERPAWGELARQWLLLLILAMLGLAGYTLLLYQALRYTSPLNAALITSFNPALIALAAIVFLRERMGWQGGLGVALGLLGVLMVLTDGRPLVLLSITYNAGDLLMLLAIAAWTAYTVLSRRLRHNPPIASTAAQALITVAIMTPLLYWTGVSLPATPHTAIAVLYIGIFPSVLSYLMWNRALVDVGAAVAGIFLNLITVATAVGTVMLGGSITASQIIGGLLVLTGVIFTTRKPRG